jgi:hypothetical protein
MRRISLMAVGLVGLAATACTVGAHTDGLEKKPAAQVERDAAAALKSAKSVHVKGTGSSGGQPVRLDLRIQATSTTGTIGLQGVSFEITTIGADTYVKADQRGWRVLGAPALVQRFAGRWVKLQPGQATQLRGFSLDSLAAQLTTNESPLEPSVEPATLDGTGAKVVVVSKQDGSKLYVANGRPAYPLRIERKGVDAGRVDFIEYGVDFHIAAPSSAVDLERAWLEAITKLHLEIDNFSGTGSTVYLTPQLMRLFATRLHGCSQELARLGAPGKRLQPVYTLVKQACAQYDRAARCFATAASFGVTVQGSTTDRKQQQSIDCGFAAPNNGSKLLADAEAKGFEITGTS